ncbi:MAG: hypothetical protein DMF19_09360 [Verrucomicrobia bacterium]|nr:MAG: hypothetical protein DMF19_09360 [Verrucomicrobiota bacterium]
MTGREWREDTAVARLWGAQPALRNLSRAEYPTTAPDSMRQLPLQKLMRNSSTHSTMLRAGFARNERIR